jgi:uncharacterized membrane protein (UPF0127 family)
VPFGTSFFCLVFMTEINPASIIHTKRFPTCIFSMTPTPMLAIHKPIPPDVRTCIVVLLAVLVLGLAGYGVELFATEAEVDISVGAVPFQVELAQTAAERQRGLMFRSHLAEGHGMLFIQPKAGPAAFWMKNTYIPLDLLYFDGEGRLLQIHADTPPCRSDPCPLYISREAIKYILEIKGGSAERLDLKVGDRLHLPSP